MLTCTGSGPVLLCKPSSHFGINLELFLELILINSEVSCSKAQSEWSLRSFAEIRKQRKLKMELEVHEDFFFSVDIKKKML